MSEQIDWSKAPEGATHWEPEGGSRAGWMKLENNIWYFWPVGKWNKYEWNETTVSDKRASTMCARPTTPSWSGEGLPPVGAFIINSEDFKGKSEVIIHRHGGVIVEQEDGVAADYVLFRKGECFAIRTPEQIAADEREAAISEMTEIGRSGDGGYVGFCGALYDAGYRKP